MKLTNTFAEKMLAWEKHENIAKYDKSHREQHQECIVARTIQDAEQNGFFKPEIFIVGNHKMIHQISILLFKLLRSVLLS